MPKRRTASGSDRETLLAEAALRFLKKQDWRTMTLASVARLARLPLSDVLSILPSKSVLQGFVLRVLAKETARRHSANGRSADPRERLFDATMTFFDVQEIHAAALKKLYRALQYDPPTLLATRNDILHLAGELLALAEADIGLSPRVQAAIFAGILIRAVSVWRDDDKELGKTMAQLDGDLRRVERLLWSKPENADVPRSPKPQSELGGRSFKKRN